MNHVSIIGNLGQDPEVKYTGSGTMVVNLNIAVNEHYKDKDGAKQQRTNWFRVTCFARLGEIVSQFCKKGSKIGIIGQLRQNTWTDKETGLNRSMVEIFAREIELLSPKGESNGTAATVTTAENGNYPDYSDDVPF
jgi:single-strand DNA-binding protein